MTAFDFSDRTAQFDANEATGVALLDGSGNGNDLNDVLGVPANTGHVVSDGGGARGLLRSADRAFTRGVVNNADPWDLRVTGTPGGLISVTFTGWVWLDNAEQGHFFRIHSVALAGQGCVLYPRETDSGGTASPAFSMADGIVPFNNRFVKATALDTIPLQTWQFVAGGWNAVTNRIFCFWGKSPGTHFYNEEDGFAAGFNYTSNAIDIPGIGFFNAEAGQARMRIDHMLYFKDRALDEAELEIIWNNHVGIDFSQLSGDTEADEATPYNYYWSSRRRRA